MCYSDEIEPLLFQFKINDMKKIFFILLLSLIPFALFAQARSLVVQNLTPCTQYYIIFGAELCACGSIFHSSVMAIAPGGTHSYMNSRSLGGTFPTTADKSIVGARIPDGPLRCSSSAGVVGEQACGLPIVYSYLSLSADCVPCESTNARWWFAPDCDSAARLLFLP